MSQPHSHSHTAVTEGSKNRQWIKKQHALCTVVLRHWQHLVMNVFWSGLKCKKSHVSNTIITLPLKFWPSISGSSWTQWFASCHSSGKADEAAEGQGAELGCVHPVQGSSKVALSQVEAQDNEPQDRGHRINSPQPENAATDEPAEFVWRPLERKGNYRGGDCLPHRPCKEDSSETSQQANRDYSQLVVSSELPQQLGIFLSLVWDQLQQTLPHRHASTTFLVGGGFVGGFGLWRNDPTT